MEHKKTRNRLLDALPEAVRERLVAAAHTCVHSEGDVLYTRGERPRQVYFPITGMASVMYTAMDGATIELENIGCEGLVGWLYLLGAQIPASDCVMRVAGRSLCVKLAYLQREFNESPPVHERVLELAQNQVIQAGQVSACNRLHPAPQRIARWLLLAAECLGSDTVPITQAGIASLLGTRRTTVTEVAGNLARGGAIEIRRGTVRIVNQAMLESHACECYGLLHGRLASLYGDSPAS